MHAMLSLHWQVIIKACSPSAVILDCVLSYHDICHLPAPFTNYGGITDYLLQTTHSPNVEGLGLGKTLAEHKIQNCQNRYEPYHIAL